MPKLTIDGQEVVVEAGTKVIDAAERLGIMIPRFCYLKSLGAVGACRMCAVIFLDGHKSRLDMSCMVDAKDGMVVSTDHPEARAFRAQIIEWLMINHPHDCPVCDEGGHCLLQDMTVSGGHSRRNYRGLKRTYPNQDLGPLIAHEMNRCIHCYRCVRFYRDYAGGTDYGTFGLATRVSYGRFEPGRLESPFAGNLGEICPTGTLTDKPSRYRARRWDLERAPSLCIHCSLGCNTLGAVRYREVPRVEARENERINGEFLCDRGRYGFGYASLPDRPRHALVGGNTVRPEMGVLAAAQRLQHVIAAHGPEAVGISVSPSCSLEDMLAASRLAAALGCPPPAFFATLHERENCCEVATQLDREIVRDLGQMATADFVLVLGADPLQEAPMTAMAIRQAARKGALVAVLDPRPVDLPCPAIRLPLSRQALPEAVVELFAWAFPDAESRLDGCGLEFWQHAKTLRGMHSGDLSTFQNLFGTVAASLARAKRPALVCSAELMPRGWVSLLVGIVRLLRHAGSDAGLCCLLPEANSLGAALLSGEGARSLEEMLQAAADGTLKAMVCVGGDPLKDFPREQWARDSVARLDTLICMDCVKSATWDAAHVALPLTAIFESGGSYINPFGLLQKAEPVFAGGTPVVQTGKGSHPPRDPGAGLPGSEPDSVGSWVEQLCVQFSEAPVSLTDGFNQLEELMVLAIVADPVVVLPDEATTPFGTLDTLFEFVRTPVEGEIIVSRRTFGSDRLASLGELARTLDPEISLQVHSADAEAFDLMDGDVVLLPLAEGLTRGILRVHDNMARSVVVLPRISGSGWQRVGGVTAPFAFKRLWKEQGDEDPDGVAAESDWQARRL